MDVLIAGGNGFIGTHLCRELTDRGHEVTVLARSPETETLPDGVDSVVGDVTAIESLDAAVADQDAVVNLVALSPLKTPTGGNEMHDRVHRKGTENLVQVSEQSGVDRFVQLSALGADPNGKTAYIRAKGRAETAVRKSDLSWVIFRPSVVFGAGGEFVSFTKRLKQLFAPVVPIYPLPGGGKTRFQPIWIGDLVSILADAIENGDHADETYDIGGPETLTLREISKLVYESEGKNITIVPLPMALAGVGLTVLGVVPGFPMGPDQYRSLQFDNTTTENDVSAFDLEVDDLKTFEEYLFS